jgi:hypothetical protein
MSLLVCVPPDREIERRYVVETLLADFLGLDVRILLEERDDVRITAPGGGEIRVADVFLATDDDLWLQPLSLPDRPLRRWKPGNVFPDLKDLCPDLPILFGQDSESPEPFMETDGQITMAIDVFGSSFFLLTGYEELVNVDRDIHGRFPAASSIGHQENFLHLPLVNIYLEILWTVMKRIWPRLERKKRRYRLLVSHDIDNPFDLLLKGLTEAAPPVWRSFRDRGLRGARDSIESWRKYRREMSSPGFIDYEGLMDLSEEAGGRSAFYFKSNREAEENDSSYRLESLAAKKRVARILERGHEVGFHPGYYTYNSKRRWFEEWTDFQRLLPGVEILGGRQHFLRFSIPETWSFWEEAGLKYDSTLSFADSVGFRCGTCYEYPVFDVRERRRLDLRERPLLAMDKSLLKSKYMGYRLGEAEEHLQAMKKMVRSLEGDFTLLWHIGNLLDGGQRELFSRSIQGT